MQVYDFFRKRQTNACTLIVWILSILSLWEAFEYFSQLTLWNALSIIFYPYETAFSVIRQSGSDVDTSTGMRELKRIGYNVADDNT